ncbi:DUF1080 domain-containing protein [Rhodopirellula sp.]|nr:DUF1080 domain-containing protein [Rhodopirellula sp.]MDB4678788.1 DUF1080 domain-containing protein [Rhodopirellula sp.]
MLIKILVSSILCCLINLSAQGNDWVNLIDGQSLDAWTKVGGEATYTLKDGVITGTTGPGKNTFLTRGPYADFELVFDVRCDPELNSGVQIRSHRYSESTPQESKPTRIREKGEVYGYQCEITSKTNGDHGCAGNFWDEGRRTRWLDETVSAEKTQMIYKAGHWNTYRIIAKGNHIQSYVNGNLVADFRDDRDSSGFIGLQVHSIKNGTGPFQVSWRNIRIRSMKP